MLTEVVVLTLCVAWDLFSNAVTARGIQLRQAIIKAVSPDYRALLYCISMSALDVQEVVTNLILQAQIQLFL